VKIKRAVITHVQVPLVEPFRISSGAVSEKDAIIVELDADGVTGYGECSPIAGTFYSQDTPQVSWTELRNIIVESGLAVGLYDRVSDTLRAIERYLTHVYHRIKLKIEPGRDVRFVKAVRHAFRNIPLFVDANGAYTLRDIDVFRTLDEFELMMFEQPFPGPSLEELAELQRRVCTPVYLDESLHSPDQLKRTIDLGSFRIANFKIQRVGDSITPWKWIRSAAQTIFQLGLVPCLN
jgi:L-alanine-DL-glutamate epimerase-like enolase superfamily enzyme